MENITSSIVESISSQNAPVQDASPVEMSGESVSEPSIKMDDDLSGRLAILSKKERSLLEKQKALAQKMKEIEERAAKYSEWEELDRLSIENPAEFYKRKGLPFEELQKKMIQSLQDDELDPIQKQIKELNQKLASKDEEYKKLLDEKLNEKETLKKQQEIEEQSKYYNQELKKFITDKSEEFDLINTFGAADEVFNVIKTVYLKTAESGNPKLMTFQEACELYEKKLEELVGGMRKSNKVSKIFGVTDSEDPIGKMYGQTTLDDSFAPSSAHSPELKTEAERLRAAAKLFEQQFKTI